jgi:hypothetical protein
MEMGGNGGDLLDVGQLLAHDDASILDDHLVRLVVAPREQPVGVDLRWPDLRRPARVSWHAKSAFSGR